MIYLDTDFHVIKPFDDLTYLDFFAGLGHVKKPEVFCGLMGTAPNHKYISKIVSELTKLDNFRGSIDEVMNKTGPYFIARVFFDTITDKDNVVMFPTKFFYPAPANKRHTGEKNLISKYNNRLTYAIHLWHTSWQ